MKFIKQLRTIELGKQSLNIISQFMDTTAASSVFCKHRTIQIKAAYNYQILIMIKNCYNIIDIP